MKNLNQMGVQEMKTQEMKQIDGGWGLIVAVVALAYALGTGTHKFGKELGYEIGKAIKP